MSSELGQGALCITDSPLVLEVLRRVLARYPKVQVGQSVRGHVDGLRVFDLRQPESLTKFSGPIILWHCQQLVPAHTLGTKRFINVHPGLNPHNRGWYPHVFSIMNGTPAGVTIHEIDEGIDTGPIIAQKVAQIVASDTSGTLYRRLLDLEEELVNSTLPLLLSGDYPTMRSSDPGSFHTKSQFNDACKISLDETMTVRDFMNRIRALSHPPYWNAYFTEGEETVFVRIELRAETRSPAAS